jgi:hypothetical protein
MKITKYLYIGAVSALLAAGLTACEDDLEHYTVSDMTPTTDFALSSTSVTIDEENLSEKLLDLAYTKSALNVTNGDVATNLDGGYILLQAATDQSFANYKTFSGNNLASLSGDDINKMAIDLGLTPNQKGTMYLRLASSAGKNIEQVLYSNIASFEVTPLEIDNHWAYIYTKDANELFSVKTAQYLYSPNNDGKYQGFVNAEPWLNFAVQTNDGTAFGTSEGTGWTFMSYEAGGDHFWLTAKAGCYYFTMDTKNTSKLANAYLITSLVCSGDVANASMVFDNVKSAWNAYIIVPKDNAKVTISGTADHYQSSQDNADETVTVGFSGEQNSVKFSLGDAGTGVTIPEKGTYKITLKLGLNSNYKFALEPAEVTVYPEKLTLGGKELITNVLDGAATGIYTGFVTLKSGAQEIKVSDDKDYGVALEVAKDGWYMVNVDLTKKRAEAVLYGNTLTASGFWSGELKINENGKYAGFVSKGDDWNFYLEDENGQTYGTYPGWDQFTFGIQEGDHDHLWLEPKGNAYIEIDPYNHTWEYAYENALLVISKQVTIGATGSGIRTILYYDEATGTYTGSYDNSADESGTNWNYYLQGVNATKDGFAYYGCVEWDNTQLEEREFADASDGHSLWVDPAKKYTMSVDLANKTIVYDELVVPTKLVVYDKDKANVVVELEAKGDGVFEGVLPAGDGWINYYIKGTADGSDKELWYGSDANWSKDDNGWANLMALNGGNLYADVTGQSLKITVNINDNSIVYTIAE